jgi:prevent-host-death family protein
MKSVSSYEVETHLPRLLEEVAAGETITITKHGVPVARLLPPDTEERPDVGAVLDQIREFRERHKIIRDGLSLKEMIEEGRM